jgi:hypothetical protein
MEKQKFIKVPEKALLHLIAEKLKDRVLFPERILEIKKLLSKSEIDLLNSDE